ncbi:MAG: Ig-like domain repeat protein, partial [Gemmatimonadales bacterium]
MKVPSFLRTVLAAVYRYTLIATRGHVYVARGILALAAVAIAVACTDALPTAPEPVKEMTRRFDTSVGGATVTTDQLDYVPGDTVTITGAGWQPGETVSLLLHETPEPTHALYNWTTVASDSGTIRDRTFVVDQSHLNVVFKLEATGVSSGRSATRDFTDGGVIVKTSAGATVTVATAIYGSSGSACPASGGVLGSLNVTPAGVNFVVPNNTFAKLIVPLASNEGGTYQSATLINAGAVIISNTLVGSTREICIQSTNGSGTNLSTLTIAYGASATTTAVTSTINPSTFGQSVTFTATVSSGSGTPTGSVQFKDGAANLGSPVTLLAGSATFATSALVAGAHSITAVYTATGVFTGSTSPALTQTVNKATPVVTWNNPAAITYGTALSGTQLNATASVLGSFAYTPAAGTILSAGVNQALSTTFTPTDAANYNSVVQGVQLTVNKATVVFSGLSTPSIVYGTSSASVSGFLLSTNGGQPATGSVSVTVSGPGGALPATATIGLDGSFTASVSGTNVLPGNAAGYAVAISYAGGTNFDLASDNTQTLVVTKQSQAITFVAPASPAVYNTSFTVSPTSGSGLTVAISVSGVCSLTGNTVTMTTGTGTCTITASQLGDDNYSAATSVAHDVVAAKATASIALSDLTHTYDATPKAATATTSPAGLSTVAVTYDGSPTPPTNAGTYAVSASLSSADYQAPVASGTLAIAKAPTTTVVTCAVSVVYTGSPQIPCTVAVTGANLSLTPSPNYANNTNAGTATASYTYAESANHLTSSDSENFTIAKALTVTAVSCPVSVVYTGSAQTPCTVSVTGANLSITPDPVHASNTNAGTATASYTYAESANHLMSSDSKNFTIAKAPTTTVVSCPASVMYTGSAQTPCTVAVTGVNLTLTPTPDYANNTDAGTATATYTYAESANHLTSSDSENFTIAKAPTTTSVTCLAGPFTYSGAPQTPCSVTVTGANLNLTPTPDYADNTNAGIATASYTYAESANHLTSSDSENFTIAKAPTVTAVSCPVSVVYTGSAQTPCSVSVTGANLSITPDPVYASNTDAGTATASYTYAESANHLTSSDSKNFTIAKAPTVTAVSCPVS